MKIKPILWTHESSNEHAIKIRATYSENGTTKVKYFHTRQYCIKALWNEKEGRVKEKHPESSQINARIEALLAEVKQTFALGSDMRSGGKDSFYWWFNRRIEYSKQRHGLYNVKKLTCAMNKLKAFRPELKFRDLTADLLTDWESHLLKNGNHINTVAENMVRVRIIVLELVRSGAIEYHKNPFLHFKIKKKKTVKRRLTFDQVQKLINLKVPKEFPSVQLAVWMYGYSFYNGGIRFGDLCRQRWEFIEDGRLKYIMHKSSVRKNIKLNEWVLDVLSKLKKHSKIKKDKSGYIFPTGVDWTSEEKSISSKNTFLNKKLIKACKMAEVPQVRFHTARHSFADFAIKRKANPYTVKEMLGHSKFDTTERYLSDLHSKENDEEMDRIFKD